MNLEKYSQIKDWCDNNNATLIAVSKTKPAADILVLYNEGQRDFGENYVQELVEKEIDLPKDIRWHFIGHLQSNKVKYIAPFVHLIHGVDSEKLLKEINKQGEKLNKKIDCLLQVHIAAEETKFGFDEMEIAKIDTSNYPFAVVKGFMGMASNTEDKNKIMQEFNSLHLIDEQFKIAHPEATILSMGMSGDYEMAVKAGSNMVRIGSLIFGRR